MFLLSESQVGSWIFNFTFQFISHLLTSFLSFASFVPCLPWGHQERPSPVGSVASGERMHRTHQNSKEGEEKGVEEGEKGVLVSLSGGCSWSILICIWLKEVRKKVTKVASSPGDAACPRWMKLKWIKAKGQLVHPGQSWQGLQTVEITWLQSNYIYICAVDKDNHARPFILHIESSLLLCHFAICFIAIAISTTLSHYKGNEAKGKASIKLCLPGLIAVGAGEISFLSSSEEKEKTFPFPPLFWPSSARERERERERWWHRQKVCVPPVV